MLTIRVPWSVREVRLRARTFAVVLLATLLAVWGLAALPAPAGAVRCPEGQEIVPGTQTCEPVSGRLAEPPGRQTPPPEPEPRPDPTQTPPPAPTRAPDPDPVPTEVPGPEPSDPPPGPPDEAADAPGPEIIGQDEPPTPSLLLDPPVQDNVALVSVKKSGCPEGFDPTTDLIPSNFVEVVYDQMVSLCIDTLPGTAFMLTDANGDGWTAVTAGDPAASMSEASWTGVLPGPIALQEVLPSGYGTPLVFCAENPGDLAEPMFVPELVDGAIHADLDAGTTLTCHWFNIPAQPATVTIEKWICPEAFDASSLPEGNDSYLDFYGSTCLVPGDGVHFDVAVDDPMYWTVVLTTTNGTVSSPVGLPAGLSDVTIAEEVPPGFAAPFITCHHIRPPGSPYGGLAYFEAHQDGAIVIWGVGHGDSVECVWYNVPGDPGNDPGGGGDPDDGDDPGSGGNPEGTPEADPDPTPETDDSTPSEGTPPTVVSLPNTGAGTAEPLATSSNHRTVLLMVPALAVIAAGFLMAGGRRRANARPRQGSVHSRMFLLTSDASLAPGCRTASAVRQPHLQEEPMKRSRSTSNGRWERSARARLTLAALLVVLGLGSFGIHPAAAQGEGNADPMAASTLTVNVELILDASGSMAEPIPGSENTTRMDAAKAAMREVIERIPVRDGLNVGFRVYGHEGSNSEADREVSCNATELLVPIDGIDKEKLLQEVDAFGPTGWTPLALSLEEAAKDFSPGGESVTNAVIMVTDGEDTCGGDPCAVAGAFHAADISLTTHVIGFALSEEQQNAVSCIAEQGGGQLYAADDADSLSEAVFSALSQVESTPEPAVETEVEVGGYVGGNAFSFLDEGQAGEISVVAVGAYDGDHLPIVVRNNTGEDVQEIQVSAIARSGGEMVATGADQGIVSIVVKDGDLGFGDVYFGEELPDDVEFEFQIFAQPADEENANELDLVVEEVGGTDNGVIGILRNPHGVAVGGVVVYVDVACFDAGGNLLDYGHARANITVVDAGGVTPFEVGVPNAAADLQTESCPIFLVAGNGHAA